MNLSKPIPAVSRVVVARVERAAIETWDNEAAPGVSWRTLISGDRTPTNELSAGLCLIEPGGELTLHRHAQAEVYHFVAGSGQMNVSGEVFDVGAGDTVFVPGDAWHSFSNVGEEVVRIFYCFPADSFHEVVYHYPDGSTWHA